MAVTAAVPIEEYLRTSYPDGDCEYVDGQVAPKPTPPFSRGEIQAFFSAVFVALRRQGNPFRVACEVRSRTSGNRVRLPDVSVYAGAPDGETPTQPPLIVLEKLAEYQAWGVTHIRVIDPAQRLLMK